MSDEVPREEEVLLAVALGSARKATDRRVLPERRTGLDRRQARQDVSYERRSGERRQAVRRKIDRKKAPRLRRDPTNGLR
jgi:hypothetical protein